MSYMSYVSYMSYSWKPISWAAAMLRYVLRG